MSDPLADAPPRATQKARRVLVVDDHPSVIEALKYRMEAMELFRKVEATSSLAGAFAELEANPGYDLVILDLHLGDSRGSRTVADLHERFPDLPLFIFTGDPSAENMTAAFESGARGFAGKTTSMDIMASAIELVLAGGSYIPVESAALVGRARSGTAHAPVRLSGRQQQVFNLLLEGKSNKVIAARLGMAEGTVKTHLNSIYRALGVSTRIQAVLQAQRLGMR